MLISSHFLTSFCSPAENSDISQRVHSRRSREIGKPWSRRRRETLLQRRRDGVLNLAHIHRGLKARNHMALPVDQELREVPADVGASAKGD